MTDNDSLVRAVILRQLEPLLQQFDQSAVQLDDDFNLMESGILDSYAFLGLLTAVEQELGCEMNLQDLDPMEFFSLGGLVRCMAGAMRK